MVFSNYFVQADGQSSNEEQKLPDVFVLKEINLEMVKCPAGSFMMGSPRDEYIRTSVLWDEFIDHKKLFGFGYNEKLHHITLTKPFYIGRYEVTQEQYSSLMGKNPSKFVGANNPVEQVSYNDAKDFCDKLNLKYLKILPQGYKFDLPTEAQWEYACRAGTSTSLNLGENITSEESCKNLDKLGWYNGNSDKKTHPVGLKKPNAWGIYDMHGNVWEWCRDWYDEYPEKDIQDPTGANSGSLRVDRGGGWLNFALGCRSANRSFNNPSGRSNDLGFRVALVPVE